MDQKLMNRGFAIFVNTTDSFEDCWTPFFSLFKNYWPGYKGRILLNTESKTFSFPGLDIVSVRNAGTTIGAERSPWSECLIRALDSLDEEIVLYLQEDYFLRDRVDEKVVDGFVGLMREHPEIRCIHLTDQGVLSTGEPPPLPGLCRAVPSQHYLVSCQAALWRRQTLRSLLRRRENAWEFEEFGSRRAALEDYAFFAVDPAQVRLGRYEIIPYIFTGIIRGRWNEKVVPLFEAHGIQVDYSRRGFVAAIRKAPLTARLLRRVRRFPVRFLSRLELIRAGLRNALFPRTGKGDF
jgi:hypothetical protein